MLRSLVRGPQRRRRGHPRSLSAEDTGLCHHRASLLGNSAVQCRSPTASLCCPAIDGGPPARPPEGSGCDPSPDHRLHLGHAHFRTAGHVVGATTARATGPEDTAGRIVQDAADIATSRSSRAAGRTSAHAPILGSFDRAWRTLLTPTFVNLIRSPRLRPTNHQVPPFALPSLLRASRVSS